MLYCVCHACTARGKGGGSGYGGLEVRVLGVGSLGVEGLEWPVAVTL